LPGELSRARTTLTSSRPLKVSSVARVGSACAAVAAQLPSSFKKSRARGSRKLNRPVFTGRAGPMNISEHSA
jgi:hypothetical protein